MKGFFYSQSALPTITVPPIDFTSTNPYPDVTPQMSSIFTGFIGAYLPVLLSVFVVMLFVRSFW